MPNTPGCRARLAGPRHRNGLALAVAGLLSAAVLASQVPSSSAAARADDLAAGRSLAFVAPNGGGEETDQVIVRDLEEGTDFTAYSGSSSPVDTVLSPGARLVGWHMYTMEDLPAGAIYVRKVAEDSKTRNVLRMHRGRFSYIDGFDFSPTGKRIAFIGKQTKDRPTSLFVIDTDGTNLRVLRKNIDGCIDNCGKVIWSPQGQRVAWYSLPSTLEDPRWRVFRFGSKRLTSLPRGFFGWSPDENRIGLVRDPLDEEFVWGSMTPGKPETFSEIKSAYPECYSSADVWSGDVVAMWTSDGLILHRPSDGLEQEVTAYPDMCDWDLR